MTATSKTPDFVTCASCRHAFELDATQQALVEKLKGQGAPFVALECPACGLSFGIDLKPRVKQEETWKCPVSHCDGWVSHVHIDERYLDGGDQWGCGECGSFWRDKNNLIKEAREIVKKFPYRSVYYETRDGQLKPTEPGDCPNDSEKIESEPWDTAEDYERG